MRGGIRGTVHGAATTAARAMHVCGFPVCPTLGRRKGPLRSLCVEHLLHKRRCGPLILLVLLLELLLVLLLLLLLLFVMLWLLASMVMLSVALIGDVLIILIGGPFADPCPWCPRPWCRTLDLLLLGASQLDVANPLLMADEIP